MSLNEEVELLKTIPLFAKIDSSKLKLLAFTSERLSYTPDQFIFKRGDVGDAAYILLEGTASVLIDTDGGMVEVAELRQGAVVGEVAILCDIERTAHVRAKGALTALKVSKEPFLTMLAEFPEIALAVMRDLASRLENTNTQLREALVNQG